ncbi:MAG: pilus assembly protein TadG-related protein [Kiritimatiellia bacterium]
MLSTQNMKSFGDPPPRSGNSGQVMVFMVMTLVIIALMVLWNFDLHTILHLKSRSQNAGDAAALAAARWQGMTLNLVGDLNIMQALALTTGDTNAAAQISGMQARLRYMGPLAGLLAAQQAAKQNGVHVNPAFSDHLMRHAEEVSEYYAASFSEPWEGCWDEYGAALKAIAREGLAAAPDNTRRYTDYSGYHTLLNQDFYDAVGGRNWCWFYRHDMALLRFYTAFTYWPDLPPTVKEPAPADSEIFGLGLRSASTVIPGGAEMIERMNQLAPERGLAGGPISNAVAALTNTWQTYNSSIWTAWSALADDRFPVWPLRPLSEYNYAGADAVTRVMVETTRLTPGAGGSMVNWTAAAKPFGYLMADDLALRPDFAGLVLPAFRHVRLVPADAASMPSGGAYDIDWQDHIYEHLESYMEQGVSGIDHGCRYCRQLEVWEDEGFRQQGLDWLEAVDEDGETLHPCNYPGGPGGGPGGGTRRGH